ncbi:MAG: hypothetical protein HKN25_17890 [Pyrinomonadaceae bacterium]|nr:hypothetical protein [Pyrinomonadaceae bacterium]
MKTYLYKTLLTAVFMFIFSLSANAQDSTKTNAALRSLNVSKKVTYVVVGKSAKYTWKATKFTAGRVAKPIIVRSAPAVGKFMLKKSGYAAKKSLPIARKLFIKYVKYKLIP